MTHEQISKILERFYENLPLKPDWIILNSFEKDSKTIAAINVDDDNHKCYAITILSLIIKRYLLELSLYRHNFTIIAAKNGFIISIPIGEKFLLGIKFDAEANLWQYPVFTDKKFVSNIALQTAQD